MSILRSSCICAHTLCWILRSLNAPRGTNPLMAISIYQWHKPHRDQLYSTFNTVSYRSDMFMSRGNIAKTTVPSRDLPICGKAPHEISIFSVSKFHRMLDPLKQLGSHMLHYLVWLLVPVLCVSLTQCKCTYVSSVYQQRSLYLTGATQYDCFKCNISLQQYCKEPNQFLF